MVFKPLGTTGVIGDQEWAKYVYGVAGQGKVAKTKNDFVITQVPGQRAISVGVGSFADGNIAVYNDTPAQLNFSAPIAGQWFAVVLRVDWGFVQQSTPIEIKGKVDLLAVAHTTTSSTVPLTYPSTFPTLNNNVGVLADIFLGWAWVNNTNTTVIFLRDYGNSNSDKPYSFANAAARDAYYPAPSTFVGRVWLQNFFDNRLVYLENTGEYQSYYAEYDGVNNTAGRGSAGWVTVTQPLVTSAWDLSYTGVPDNQIFSNFSATVNNALTNNPALITYNQSTGLFTIPPGFWTCIVRLTNSTDITTQASIDIQDTTSGRFWGTARTALALTNVRNFGTVGAGTLLNTSTVRISFLKISGANSNITGNVQFIRAGSGL